MKEQKSALYKELEDYYCGVRTKEQTKKEGYEKINELYKKTLKIAHITIADYIIANRVDIKNKISLNITVATVKNALDYIYQIDIKDVVGFSDNCVNYDCPFVDGNIASVNFNDLGYYKYFTRDKTNSKKMWLNIVDIFEIVYSVSYYQAIILILQLANIKVTEMSIVSTLSKSYVENIKKIEDYDKTLYDYMILNRYIGKHMYFLKELNEIGMKNIMTDNETVDGRNVFFASSRYLAEEMTDKEIKINYSTANRLINLFCILGFLKKVKIIDLPESSLKDEIRIRKLVNELQNKKTGKKNFRFDNDYFVVMDITKELLQHASEVAQKLSSAGLSATKLTIESLKDVLTEDEISDAYDDYKQIIIAKAVKSRMIRYAVKDEELPF